MNQRNHGRGQAWQERARPDGETRNNHRPRRDVEPNQVRQVGRHRHTYIHTPHEERNNDFHKSIRGINNLIVALHHSHNVNIDKYPESIARKEQELMDFIKPAKPTDRTLLLLQGCAKNWSYTILLILIEHFSTLIENTKKDLSQCLTQEHDRAFSIATKWARKNLGKRLTENTLGLARAAVTELFSNKTHTPTHPTPQVPCPPPSRPSPPSSSSTGNPGMEGPRVDPTGGSRTPGSTTQGPLELTQEEFPDLPTPGEPWTPQQNPGNTPRPQREHPTRRQTTPPRDTPQRTTQERRNSEGNQTTPERPTEDTTTQRETPAQEETNQTEPREPRSWRGGSKANKQRWRFVPDRNIIIIGDSNLNRIPTITDDRIQIESYAGMNLEWAEAVLSKAETNETATHLILSVGINNMGQKTKKTSHTALKKLRETAKRKFPYADRRIALINYTEDLDQDPKDILQSLNEEIRKEPHLPELPANNFETESDNIHWKEDTAKAMLQHWINSLN